MAVGKRRPVAGLIAVFVVVVLVIVGVRAWQLIAPALGWTSPVIATVPPELPAGLARARAGRYLGVCEHFFAPAGRFQWHTSLLLQRIKFRAGCLDFF